MEHCKTLEKTKLFFAILGEKETKFKLNKRTIEYGKAIDFEQYTLSQIHSKLKIMEKKTYLC